MNGFVFILGTLLIVAGVGLNIYKKNEFKYKHDNQPPKCENKKSLIALVILGIIVIIFSASFTIIPTGYTGVRSTFGQINENTAPNGFNFNIPFVEKIEKVNNKQQDIVFRDNKISSETIERNTVVFSGITVTYKIDPNKSAWIAANVSDYEDNLINESLVSSAIKTTSKTLTPTDVTNRSILEPKAQENIQQSLDEKYGKNVVTINKVIINNASFDKAYDDKIAKKQQAQMDYERQQIENKKNIEKAQADADVKIKEAEGNAKAKKINAQAEADANKLLEKALTDKILQSKMLDKWNGELPKVSGNGSSILDITSILGK